MLRAEIKNDKAKIEISKRVKQNIPLKDYTTFKIGGAAKFFFEAKSKEEVIEAVKWAREKKEPFFVLGGGSNLLVADKGFEGIVIKIKNSKLRIKNYNSKFKIIESGAGVKLSDLVKLSGREGLSGLEWASGIPEATVGGAIRGNAAAFENSMKDIVKNVEALDASDGKAKNFQLSECGFSDKGSIFKKNKNLIILSASIILKKADMRAIKEKIDYVLNYRKEHHPLEFPSSGCTFKNPEGQPAALLIDKCGLKGKRIGDAQISPKHANFIVNLGKAKASDVLKLIELAKKEVKNKFNIELEEEISIM